MLWLDVFELELLTELRQVVSEHCLVELHDLADLDIVKAIERHDGVLSHQITERNKALILIVHEQEQDSRHIRHALDVADIWPVHRERFQDSLKLHVMWATLLEQAGKLRESPWDVCVNNLDALLSCQVSVCVCRFDPLFIH